MGRAPAERDVQVRRYDRRGRCRAGCHGARASLRRRRQYRGRGVVDRRRGRRRHRQPRQLALQERLRRNDDGRRADRRHARLHRRLACDQRSKSRLPHLHAHQRDARGRQRPPQLRRETRNRAQCDSQPQWQEALRLGFFADRHLHREGRGSRRSHLARYDRQSRHANGDVLWQHRRREPFQQQLFACG